MRRRRNKSSKNLAKLVIGSRNGWVTRLQAYRYPAVWAPPLVFLFRGSLVGLPTWRGEALWWQRSRCTEWSCIIFCAYIWNFFSCRLMKAQTMGDTSSLEFMRGRRVFEINPQHPIIKDLNVWSIWRVFFFVCVRIWCELYTWSTAHCTPCICNSVQIFYIIMGLILETWEGQTVSHKMHNSIRLVTVKCLDKMKMVVCPDSINKCPLIWGWTI